MSEHDLIHLFLEIAAIREYDGGMSREAAERAAYYDWRKIVGRDVVVPEFIRERAKKFPALGTQAYSVFTEVAGWQAGS